MICGYSVSSVVVLSLCWWGLMHWSCKFWLTYQFSLLLPVPLVSCLRSRCLPQGHGGVLLYFYLLLFRPQWLPHLFVKTVMWMCVCEAVMGQEEVLPLWCRFQFSLKETRALTAARAWDRGTVYVCRISWCQQPPPGASGQSERVSWWTKCIVVDECIVDEKFSRWGQKTARRLLWRVGLWS